jgi:hypothetical protein
MALQVEEQTYIGLMAIGQIWDNQTTLLQKEDEIFYEDEIIQLYQDAKQINPFFAYGLAIYYENRDCYEAKIIEREYLTAIPYSDDGRCLVNFADFYKVNGDTLKMQAYLGFAVEKFNDIEAMILLATFYAGFYDNEMYQDIADYLYSKAVEMTNKTPIIIERFLLGKYFEVSELIGLQKMVETRNLCKANPLYEKLQLKMRENQDVCIYHNKVRLFTQLNHIVECGVCLEVELNINLNCGHCVCTKCYVKLYKNRACPFCRIIN